MFYIFGMAERTWTAAQAVS